MTRIEAHLVTVGLFGIFAGAIALGIGLYSMFGDYGPVLLLLALLLAGAYVTTYMGLREQ